MTRLTVMYIIYALNLNEFSTVAKTKLPHQIKKKNPMYQDLSILRLTSEANELIECCFVCRVLTSRAMKIVFNSFVDFIF